MPARPCVLDASLLISLGKAGQVDVLSKAPSYRWHIGPITRAELRRRETRDPVERLIVQGLIAPEEVDSEDPAMAAFAEWSERVDPGEAEAIALALARGWAVGLEDLDARRLLDRLAGSGRWINCANILLDAVEARTMTLSEADGVFRRLDVYPSYQKAGVRSLSQLRP